MTTATAPGGLATPLAASASRAASEAAPLRRPVPAAPEARPARVHRLAHGRLTLDELVSGAWAAIGAGAPAACPVCDGPLRGAGEAAECSRCGSALS